LFAVAVSFAAVVVMIVLFYRSRLWVFSKNAELAVAKGSDLTHCEQKSYHICSCKPWEVGLGEKGYH
jgi:hypothetical protein